MASDTFPAANREGGEEAVDELFEALAHRCRRRVVLALADADHGDGAGRSELSLDDDRFDDSRLELHHRHLPRLDDAGVVEWNRETGQIARGPRFEEVRELLAAVRAHEATPPA